MKLFAKSSIKNKKLSIYFMSDVDALNLHHGAGESGFIWESGDIYM